MHRMHSQSPWHGWLVRALFANAHVSVRSQRTRTTVFDMQAAGPEPPEPVTAPGGVVSKIQSAVQANLMAAPVSETADHSSEADAIDAIARQFACEKQELIGLLRQLLELFAVIFNGNIRTVLMLPLIRA